MKALDAPLVWLIAFLVAAWAQVRLLPLPLPFAPAMGHDLGAFAILAGLFFVIAALMRMRREQTTALPHAAATALVTTGVFSKSRNPIYLGFVLILAGVALWLGSIVGVILVPVLVVVLSRRFILPEEAHLRGAFGTEFDAYAEKTRRWL